jgi:hypothetical protein
MDMNVFLAENPHPTLEVIPVVETVCPLCARTIRFVASNFADRIESSELEYWKKETIKLRKERADIEEIRKLNGGYYR